MSSYDIVRVQPLLLTLLFVALVSWAIGWVGGWLVRGYRMEVGL